MIFQNEKLKIRLIEEKDIPLLSKWLSDPEVLQYYEGRDNPFDEERVRKTFFTKEESTYPCIVEYGIVPIGYLQFYKLDKESKAEYGYEDFHDEILYGMDQFIGETDYWNKGIGSLLVSSVAAYITESLGADKVVMDPQVWNVRALACYEKCHFKKIRLLEKHELHEGEYHDCYVIEYTKQKKLCNE